VWASAGVIDESATFLGLRPEQVSAAADYYADYASEIDELITLNREDTERIHKLSERQQKARRR